MSDVIFNEGKAFQGAWNACDSVFEGFNVLGLALRRASGNPVMRQFKQTVGDAGFNAYYEELHPLMDEDIDYVMGKLARQAKQVEAQLPTLPYSGYKEARALIAQDKQLQRYVDRVISASQSAWTGARSLYDLAEIGEDKHATDFVTSVRHLGLPARDMQLKVISELVLSCKPSYLQDGRLRTTHSGRELDNYVRAYAGVFGRKMIRLLHTKVPTS